MSHNQNIQDVIEAATIGSLSTSIAYSIIIENLLDNNKLVFLTIVSNHKWPNVKFQDDFEKVINHLKTRYGFQFLKIMYEIQPSTYYLHLHAICQTPKFSQRGVSKSISEKFGKGYHTRCTPKFGSMDLFHFNSCLNYHKHFNADGDKYTPSDNSIVIADHQYHWDQYIPINKKMNITSTNFTSNVVSFE